VRVLTLLKINLDSQNAQARLYRDNYRANMRYYAEMGKTWAEEQNLGFKDGVATGRDFIYLKSVHRAHLMFDGKGARAQAEKRAVEINQKKVNNIYYFAESEEEYDVGASFIKAALAVFKRNYTDGVREGKRLPFVEASELGQSWADGVKLGLSSGLMAGKNSTIPDLDYLNKHLDHPWKLKELILESESFRPAERKAKEKAESNATSFFAQNPSTLGFDAFVKQFVKGAMTEFYKGYWQGFSDAFVNAKKKAEQTAREKAT